MTVAWNSTDGILLAQGNGVTIGGTSANARNVISGNVGFGIRAAAVTDLVVQGNFVGTDWTGNSPIGNDGGNGIDLTDTVDALIGGTDPGAGNVVGGNEYGIYVNFPDGGLIQGNSVGVGADGADVGNTTGSPLSPGIGITIDGDSGESPMQIGGTTAAARNLVGHNEEGILLTEAQPGTVVLGNDVGLSPGGSHVANGIGIEVASTNGAVIGGATTGARNVISRNDEQGVLVSGGSIGTQIQGNYIGTDSTGLDPNGNRIGIEVTDAGSETAIGGAATTAGEPPGNVIADSQRQGVLIDGDSYEGGDPNANVLRSNLIGLDATGDGALPNGRAGVEISGGAYQNIVGNDTGSGLDYNVISASGDGSWPGVLIDASDENVVAGNRLGTNMDGTAAFGNDTGVTISGGAVDNRIGTNGSDSGDGNLISGNSIGVHITGTNTRFNSLYGNLIGTKLDGQDALHNTTGVLIDNGPRGNFIGGSDSGFGNVISGNWGSGVLIDGPTTHNNLVQGNTIGLQAGGDPIELPNDVGIWITNDAYSNIVGETGEDGPTPGNTVAASETANIKIGDYPYLEAFGNSIVGNTIQDSLGPGVEINGSNNHLVGNTIKDNTADLSGVDVLGGTGNTISQNSILGNLGLGIDLGADGVTLNDSPGDPDTGPNDFQNFPVIASADLGGGDLNVSGTIDSDLDDGDGGTEHFTIEVFSSPGCDSSDYGQGETYLGSTEVDASPYGPAAWSFTDTGTTVTPGQQITATATDSIGNTSEFSHCLLVGNTPLSATIDLSQDDSNVRAGAQSVPVGGIDLAALTRGAGPNTQSAPLDGIPLEGIDVAGSPLEGIPLEGIGLTPQILNQALGGVHLSDIPLQPPANWPALLVGTRLANVPLSTLTLADVLALPTPPAALHNITLGTISLRGSPLEGIGLGGIALGPKLLSAVPLEGIGTTPAQNLQDWCDAINAQPGYSCSSPTTLTNETVISQVVRGVPLEGIPLDGIPLEGIDLADTPLEGIPLEGIDLSGTPLEGIPLEGINMAVSPLEGIPLEGINIIGSPLEGIPLEGIPRVVELGDRLHRRLLPAGGATRSATRSTQNRIKPGATLGMLDGGFGNVTLDDLVDALKPGSGRLACRPGEGTAAGAHAARPARGAARCVGLRLVDVEPEHVPARRLLDDGGVAHYHADFEVTGGALLTSR